MTPKKDSFADRFFRWLLRMFPSEFRGDYGGEMEAVFRQQRRDAQKEKAGIFRLWGETIAGIFRTAPGEHLEMFRQDGGYALRMMRKNLGFTALVIGILALGIGANTAIFSVVNGVLLRPLPYAEGGRLVTLQQEAPKMGMTDQAFSVHEVEDYRAMSKRLDAVVEYHSMSFDLLGVGDPQRVTTGVVSANFFEVLGVRPLWGRSFVAGDDAPGAPAVLMVSYEYWKAHFGGDPGVVGKKFRMNDREHTLIGVLPFFPQYPDVNDIYMPTSACPFRSDPKLIADRDSRMMSVFGRMKKDVTIEQSQAELSAIAGQLQQAYPKSYPKEYDYNVRAASLQKELTATARPTFLILLATAGLVLLIVCANVANLSLARQLRREREMAVRSAMGASRSRLLRQMVTESTILSLAGGALGVLLAWGGLDLLISFAARFTSRAQEITLDSRVLLFSLGISVLTGILFGSIPSMFPQRNISTPLKEGWGQPAAKSSKGRIRNALVVAQVALSFTLMVGAGLLLHSFYLLTRVDPGFHPENIVSMLVELNFTKYAGHADRQRAFQHQLLEKVEQDPFVVSAAFAETFPLNAMSPMRSDFRIEGRDVQSGQPKPTFDLRAVSPDYFKTLGIPLEQGRLLSDQDVDKSPAVALVNQTMARHYWGNESPVGRRISADSDGSWITIVGVVGDVRQYGFDKPPVDELYVSLDQANRRNASLLVRTRQDPNQVIRQIIAAVSAMDPNQPVSEIHTLEQLKQRSLAPPRLTSTLLGCFALLALAITGAGIAGVMGLSVSQRTKEIGIRMALGATQGSVLRLVLRQGLLLIVLGLGLGVGLALSGTRLMQGLLFGIEPTDPFTLVGVTILLLTVAAVACYGPARRATSVDPLAALRAD